jgi:hypothetical protein
MVANNNLFKHQKLQEMDMYSHPLIVEMLARERQTMFLQEAQRDRLIRQVKANADPTPSWRTKVLMTTAEFLIFLGIKLKEKVAPGACPAAYPSGSSCHNGCRT